MKTYEFLDEIPAFSSLTDTEIQELSSRIYREHIPSNKVIQLQGDTERQVLAVLIGGRANGLLYTEDGREVLIELLGPGDIWGECSLVPEIAIPAPWSVVTTQPSTFLFIPASELSRLFRSNPTFGLSLYSMVVSRLIHISHGMHHLIQPRGEDRIIGFLQRLAQLHGKKDDKGVLLLEPVSHRTIAGSCGLTRETVTRLLSRLKNEGRVKKLDNGWWVANNPEPLP